MSIAEKIYAEVQTLPDELASEVLDFVHFLESRHAIRQQRVADPKPASRPRIPGSAKGKLTVLVEDDEHLRDFRDYM
jgi:hypothetical protein